MAGFHASARLAAPLACLCPAIVPCVVAAQGAPDSGGMPEPRARGGGAEQRVEHGRDGVPSLLLLEFLGEWQASDGTAVYPDDVPELSPKGASQGRRSGDD